jgi:leucyl aminopeptidase
MEDMKWDMGGAGAVTGAMRLLAARKAQANVIGICALVENMPDGNAQRPGDVWTSLSGQTVEVINTDAEGRLILCDAMWYVQEKYKPQAMVELSTLTGAIIVALGHERAGLSATTPAVHRTAQAGLGDRREAVAHAARSQVRQADRLRHRRHEERQAAAATAVRSRRRSSCSASCRKASPGPISTSPAWRGRARATRPRPRAPTAYGVRLLDS